MKNTAVLYHYPCPDGALAALAAHLHLSASSTHSLFFPTLTPLSGLKSFLLTKLTMFTSLIFVVVLDHHKTALETLKDGTSIGVNVIRVIDMDRSGATIAFDFFKEKVLALGNNDKIVREFERARPLFEYVEDADLWRWNRHNSKAFSSDLKDLNIEFHARLNPSLFQQLLSVDLDSVISQGMMSLSHKQTLITEVLDQSYEISLGGGDFGRCLAVNADSVSELRSELGHQLANKSCRMSLRFLCAENMFHQHVQLHYQFQFHSHPSFQRNSTHHHHHYSYSVLNHYQHPHQHGVLPP